MAIYGWNIVQAVLQMPGPGQTVATAPFSVPRSALVLAIYCPALAGGATLKIQGLAPQMSDQESELWYDVSTFDLGGSGTPVALAAIPGNAATTVPITATGAGVLKLVASSDQSGSPSSIRLGIMCL
jgi:hypothetical protein